MRFRVRAARRGFTVEIDLDAYNAYCESLTATTHVVQWGDANVWKVGGKVFAIAGWGDTLEARESTGPSGGRFSSKQQQVFGPGEFSGLLAVTFKTTPDEYDFLIEIDGVRPAPYLASRGFTWAQHYRLPGLDDDDLREQLAESHRLVGLGLSKKKQRELGLSD